jgi:nucleotide-binding universal stress UspA family protein
MAIVVGVDGSEESIAALRWALEEARLRDTTVRALRAWELPYASPPLEPLLPGSGFPQFAVDVDEIRGAVEEQLDRVVSEAVGDAAGVRIEQELVQGHAADELVKASKGADLLVVGSRGHGGFSGLLLGSVSQACVQHARCPVVVVRETAAG